MTKEKMSRDERADLVWDVAFANAIAQSQVDFTEDDERQAKRANVTLPMARALRAADVARDSWLAAPWH